MKFLDKLKTSVEARPAAMMIYGPPGSAKTSLASQFPDVVFAVGPQEKGIEDLKGAGLAPASVPVGVFEQWEDLQAFFDELFVEEHPYRWLACDTLTEYQRLCFEFITRTKCGGDPKKFQAYGAGYDLAVPEWDGMIRRWEKLRDKGIGSLLLAHSKVRTFNDPAREAYDRYVPDLQDGKNSSLLSGTLKYCTDIGFIMPDIDVTESERTKRTRAHGGRELVLHFNSAAAFEAKNRRGLTREINLGKDAQEAYTNLCAAFSSTKESAGAA